MALAKQGRIEEAIRPLQEAVRLAPESAEARNYLGSLYAAQGRYDEAAKFFQDALRVRPDYAQAHQSLAQLLLLQGKKEEAAVHYQAALRLMKQKGATSEHAVSAAYSAMRRVNLAGGSMILMKGMGSS